MAGRRYLTASEAIAALRRGAQVEQLLPSDGVTRSEGAVRWLVATRLGRGFELRLHEVEDLGSADFFDVTEMPPLDPDEELGEGRTLEHADDPGQLLEAATAHGAENGHWVNQGVVQDEYVDRRNGLRQPPIES